MAFHFEQLLQEKGIYLSPWQRQQFHTYYQQLIAWNQKMNLTTIREEEAVYIKHFYDSLTLAFYHHFQDSHAICDVGAGAGFPSLPLKICFPHLQVTIIDTQEKRCSFLRSLREDLQLHDVWIYHARAEAFSREADHRETFDVVTARAVAKLSVLSEYCLPLVREGGRFLAMKGSDIELELQQSRQAMAKLGGTVADLHAFFLPGDAAKRHIVEIEKTAKTPNAFPRKPGKPGKQPL